MSLKRVIVARLDQVYARRRSLERLVKRLKQLRRELTAAQAILGDQQHRLEMCQRRVDEVERRAREAERLAVEGARAVESLLETEMRHAQALDAASGAGR